jgi:hypothetical protein
LAFRAIDAWVNVHMPGRPAAWQEAVARDVFKRPAAEVFRSFSVEEMLEVMDRLGVERALLSLRAERPSREVLTFVEKRPDRFWLAPLVDPRRGMTALRELEALARSQPIVAARVIPSLFDLPPDDRVYYPLYAKCIELGLAVTVNTGIPGPPLPAASQDPMRLDVVCLFFPEVRIVMANGADPWWNVAIRLMAKYKNLYMMTSAYAPKFLPGELIDYMNKRGKEKVLFATDFPFLTIDRCLEEAGRLDLGEGVLDNYLSANAMRVFFPKEGAAIGSTQAAPQGDG